MQGSKLLDTLALFSLEELHLINHFLQSPRLTHMKNQKEHIELFQYLLAYRKGRVGDDLSKATVYAYLFPTESFIKGKLDKLMSGLLKEIHQFISFYYREGSDDNLQNAITLLSFFRQRDQGNKEQIYLNKAKKAYDRIVQKDKHIYFRGFQINDELIRRNYLLQGKAVDSFDYDSVLQPLDAYYLLNKLEYACFFLSMDRFRKPIPIDGMLRFLDAIKPLYESRGLLDIPLVDLYYQTYEMLKNVGHDEKEYWKLKELIYKYELEIPREALQVLISIIRNFVIWHANHGAEHLVPELFEMNKEHLEKGYLNFEKGLLPSTYKNIVRIGLSVKEYDWVYHFLENYRAKIEGTSSPEDVYHYNLAIYFFERAEYDKSLELLADQYEDLFYKIDAKRLELKVYFETQSTILESKMDAFKVYIFRLPEKVILEHKRTCNNNFINFLRQLYNPKTNFSPKRIEKLKAKISKTKLLSEKAWLLEKLNSFKV